MRHNFLDRIIYQMQGNVCIEADTDDAVTDLREKMEGGTIPTGCTFIISDYAHYALAEGMEARAAAAKYRKDVDYIASHSKAAGICVMLFCSRPCIDVLTMRMKHLFPHRVAFKTTSRVDSVVILDSTMAAGISDDEIVYRDEISCEVLNMRV